MFALVYPHNQDDPLSIAEELACMTNFLAYAVEHGGYTGDASARNGASLLVAAIGRSLQDLRTVTDNVLLERMEAAYTRGLADGRAGRRTPAPDLTEPTGHASDEERQRTA